MWLDDEGIYTKPVNPLATALAVRFGKVWQDYHGPVVLCSSTPDGDCIELTTQHRAAVLTALADLTRPTTPPTE